MPGFTEILNQMNVKWHHGSKPSEVNICCPFCVDRGETEDEKFKLGVNTVSDTGHCFNCDYASRKDTQLWILRKLGATVDVKEDDIEEEEPEKPELPDDFQLLSEVTKDDELGVMAVRYARRRGLTVKQICQMKIGCSFLGRYAYRLVFPVRYRGELKGIVARDITSRGEPKYLNSKGSKFLYNLRPPKRDDKGLVLSEGIFKALAIEHYCSIRSAALLGHSISEDMISAIKDEGYRSVLVWPDPDTPGIRGLITVANACREAGLLVWVIWPAPKKQADELTSGGMYSLITYSQRKWTWSLEQKVKLKLAF